MHGWVLMLLETVEGSRLKWVGARSKSQGSTCKWGFETCSGLSASARWNASRAAAFPAQSAQSSRIGPRTWALAPLATHLGPRASGWRATIIQRASFFRLATIGVSRWAEPHKDAGVTRNYACGPCQYLHSQGESAKSSTGENHGFLISRLESVVHVWNGTCGHTLCRRGRWRLLWNPTPLHQGGSKPLWQR